ncbi:uncharacterized protein LOC131618895 [Vicia villosa]|uniref:uncharacterized protein LOC131618895 n=1 Tax=Vicia villosa TaxID=3911 RepID=UPI00273A7AF2|nr:uncharacterized protein LOC131618895 [Vicia villosa]
MAPNVKILAQDPLEEVDLGDGSLKRVTYISAKLEPDLKTKVIALLKENKYCFAWDYDEMPGLETEIKNQEANDLAQLASGYKVSKEKLEELIEVLNIDSLADIDWRSPIVNYLKDPLTDTKRKVKYRVLSYFLMGNELFKKTPEGVLLKCLGETEAYLALSNVHSGACGAHQAAHKMKWLLFHYGMYWHTMLKGCLDFAKGCQDYKVHASIQHSPANELSLIIKSWPFRGWALDPIGEIRPTSSKGQRYILVGIDYFTKWVEEIPLANIDQEVVIEFIQKHILYRFGLPESITTDQGSVFTGRKMQEFAKEMGFKLLTSTPYYAQENRQVEAANKVIIGLMKKHVGKKPKSWHKTLDQELWACQTSPKEATNTTLFKLTFGHDAVLPVEIYLQSVRIQKQEEISPNIYWEMMMNELVDLDEERFGALEMIKRQKERVAKAYNKKVKASGSHLDGPLQPLLSLEEVQSHPPRI